MGSACPCPGRIGASPWLTAAATGLTAGLLGWIQPAITVGAPLVGLHPIVSAPAGASPVVALLVGALLVGVVVGVAVLGVLLATVDLACRRLPDRLVGALAMLVIGPLCGAALMAGEPGRLGRAVLGAGLLGIAYLLILILPGGPLGFGDVKLAAVLGFALGFVGWPAVLLGAVVPHLLNGPVAVVLLLTRRAGRRTELPFGPALLVGAVIALLATAV